MRALAAALLIALAWPLAGCAPAPAPRGEPALWRISDLDSEIWLFGAVHVLPSDLRWRSVRIDAAFDAADELVVETDSSDAEAVAALTAQYGLLPSDARLSHLLPERDAARLVRVSAALGVDPLSLDRLRPWLAALRLSFAFAMAHGQQSDAGVEAVLLPEAQARGMQISYLETPEQQIRTLAELSDADQLRFLQASLRQIEEDGDTLGSIDRAWASGDLLALDRELRAQLSEAGPGPYAAIITRRNEAWADEVAQRLGGSGRIFYAVGAAHLVGDSGVPALLRRRGISVEGP